MRVPLLLLPMSLGIGGAETHVVFLAKHLSARGWDVHVASGGGELVKELERSGIEHIMAPLDSRSPASMLRSYQAIQKIVAERHIGLVHAHARIPAWIAGKVCARRGIPMVMTYHGTFASGPFWNFFTRPGDRTIAISEDIRDYVVREFAFHPENITVIPNGIDLEVFREPSDRDREDGRRSLSVPVDASPVVVYSSRLEGNLVPVGHSVIDAVLLLKAKYPRVELLVAGDGEGLPALQEHAARVSRSAGYEIARCTGYLPDTFPLYAASDLVVGMSRVALEAMASCRPVVIAGPGGIFGPVRPEALDTLEDRNYTSRNAPDPLSPEDLAQQIGRLLADGSLRQDLGRFGRETVSRLHSMEQVTDRTEQVYFSLLAARTGKVEGTLD